MSTNQEDTYLRLISCLDEQGVTYRLIDHPPEGRTEVVSPIRGNSLLRAAATVEHSSRQPYVHTG
ncbi:MAG: hypothetical protein ACLQUY_13775 [Ktedonobacterales bacterium]